MERDDSPLSDSHEQHARRGPTWQRTAEGPKPLLSRCSDGCRRYRGRRWESGTPRWWRCARSATVTLSGGSLCMMIYGPSPTIQMSDRVPASGASSPMTSGANEWLITPATNPTVPSASSLSSKSFSSPEDVTWSCQVSDIYLRVWQVWEELFGVFYAIQSKLS